MRRIATVILLAAFVAGIAGGLPSTLYLILAERDMWAPVVAAGSIVMGADADRSSLLVAACVVHAAFSIFWAAALRVVLLTARPVLWGAIGGAVIALLDLKIIGAAFPLVAALDFWPQFVDHVIFGGCVGAVLKACEGPRSRRRRPASGQKSG